MQLRTEDQEIGKHISGQGFDATIRRAPEPVSVGTVLDPSPGYLKWNLNFHEWPSSMPT
jgi:hypothetical protein